jgi:hypothetical protein
VALPPAKTLKQAANIGQKPGVTKKINKKLKCY